MIKVNGEEWPWHQELSIVEILKELKNDYPIVVKVNGKPVLKKQYSTFEVPDGAEVNTVEIIAGG